MAGVWEVSGILLHFAVWQLSRFLPSIYQNTLYIEGKFRDGGESIWLL